LFADYLLSKAPEKLKNIVSRAYNATLKELGDENPDFISAVSDLTNDACVKRNEILKEADGVYKQSVGSIMNKPRSGKFPLNLSYRFVKNYDGENDGLVGENSFEWGEKYILLKTEGKRGISHGDMIDLNRENIKDFDVRKFYVDLVNDLKNKGF
jgi:triacylglycerol lipase